MLSTNEKDRLEWDNIKSTFPQWASLSPEDFCVERLSGLSNYVYKIYVPALTITPPVVYKVFSSYFSCLQDRHREHQVSKMLEKTAHGPKVYYSSATSRIEQFWEYNHVSVEEMVEQQKMNSIAHEIAYYHSRKEIEQDNSSDSISHLKSQSVRQAVEAAIRHSILPQDQVEEMDSMVKVVFSDEFIAQAQQIIESSKSPLVFAHNDTNSTNLLYDKLNDKMYFLDYEYAGYNYRGFEFGNFFNEQLWDYEVKTPPFFAVRKHLYPAKHKRDLFFAHYILGWLNETQGKINGISQEDNLMKIPNKKTLNSLGLNEVITEIIGFNDENFQTKERIMEYINKLDAEADAGKLLSHTTWFIVAALSFAYKELHFDCFSYCKLRFQEMQDILEARNSSSERDNKCNGNHEKSKE